MKRWLLVAGAVIVVLTMAAFGLKTFLTPDHRTTFLVDASESADFREVAEAVGSAASNMSSGDALALRRFGGACDSANTAELVPPGTGQAAKIGDAARSITPSGKATLLSGILAAIDDFARTYPFRGNETNRIVVVARGNADACGKNADEVRQIIKQHTEKAGVKIDFRFVGYKLTPQQAKALNAIAEATEARATRFTDDTTELVTTMKEVSVPAGLVAQEVKLPKTPCEEVTPESLMAAYPQRPAEPQRYSLYYFDLRCHKDRYLMARLQTEPKITDDLFLQFEFDGRAWQYVDSGTAGFSCNTAPKDVWEQWPMSCVREPVVCRESKHKVTDLTGGDVPCPVALDIADRYLAAIAAEQTGGQGRLWGSGDWECAWVYLEGRSHADSPLRCTRKTDDAKVQIGD